MSIEEKLKQARSLAGLPIGMTYQGEVNRANKILKVYQDNESGEFFYQTFFRLNEKVLSEQEYILKNR